MINYETIISNFDDKTTLYNWLRKVEEALKHASATNFVVNKKGNATLSFSITFADGTTLESGDIVLQQGESVDGARIASGVLQLHLTNGTWLTAGNLGAVSSFSIDANQHLIVNYQDGTSQDLGAIFSGNINISGDLTATGDIKAPLILELNSGYSFGNYANYNPVFAGISKTGNKLSIAIFGNAYFEDSVPSTITLGDFTIPTSVGSKLYPYNIDGSNVLSQKNTELFDNSSTGNAGLPVSVVVTKLDNGHIRFYLMTNTQPSLTTGKTYNFRHEVTFLLSDNMVGA